MAKFHNNKLVEQCLATDKRCRQDDKWLILQVWRRTGLSLTPDQERIFLSKKLPSTETIRRTRQKLQEEGKYLAPKEVQEARSQLETQTRYEVLGKEPPETNRQTRIFDNPFI